MITCSFFIKHFNTLKHFKCYTSHRINNWFFWCVSIWHVNLNRAFKIYSFDSWSSAGFESLSSNGSYGSLRMLDSVKRAEVHLNKKKISNFSHHTLLTNIHIVNNMNTLICFRWTNIWFVRCREMWKARNSRIRLIFLQWKRK